MKLIIKYSVVYLLLIIIVASRVKVSGNLNNLGLFFESGNSDKGMKMITHNWNGFEGSIVHFFAVAGLFLLCVFDNLYKKVEIKFFQFNCFIFCFALFAFEESFIRGLAIVLFYVTINQLTQVKQNT